MLWHSCAYLTATSTSAIGSLRLDFSLMGLDHLGHALEPKIIAGHFARRHRCPEAFLFITAVNPAGV